MKTKLIGALAISTILTACATPHVVNVSNPTDHQLSCSQLLAQINEAKDFENKARSERKVTGKNVAAALFFWPALLGTYSNTEEAINAARDRQQKLTEIYQQKQCR